MDEIARSSTAVIQHLIPALATALARLRRSPGRDEAWVAQVLATLERHQPARYDRLRRRLGFARRLAQLAGFALQEQAVLILGLFFSEIIGDQPDRQSARPARVRTWSEYLLRHEEWLAPCFQVSQTVQSPGWDEADSRPAVVARVASIFDLETIDHHGRPLQVLESLLAQAEEPTAQQIIPLLWSEDGQELCDRHFRRHPQAYRLDADDIRQSLELLKRDPQRPAAEVPAAPMRLSGAAFRPAEQREAQPPEPQASQRPAAFDNFERRRQALRSHSISGPPEAVSEDTSRPQQEVNMDNLRSISSLRAEPRDDLDLLGNLEEVQRQFDRIQQLASEGQRLLTELTPKLEEFASWIVAMETMVDRWKGREQPGEQRAA